MGGRTYVGFGFGAIQAGLFLYEARKTGRFSRLVVAEIVRPVVETIRATGGYSVNIAARDGVRRERVDGIEIYNPADEQDLAELVEAVRGADEIGTALPDVGFYGGARPGDPARILAAGLSKRSPSAAPALIYTAENHNHAAEILREGLASLVPAQTIDAACLCLNTVIGKMSAVVTGRNEIADRNLAPIAEGADRAFLVEEFNRILISRIAVPGVERGLQSFVEKADLLPFEEAKLYGHNAAHAMLGFLLRLRGRALISDAASEPDLLASVRDAFLNESGAALCRKHDGLDPLFTERGYSVYVADLIERMTNPWLGDTVARVTRDPSRKLQWEDRLIGAMRLALSQDIPPANFARGAAAAVRMLADARGQSFETTLSELWRGRGSGNERNLVARLVADADPRA